MVVFCSCSNVSIAIAVVYFAVVAQQIFLLMNPLYGVDIKDPSIKPSWTINQKYNIVCFISARSNYKSIDLRALRRDNLILFEKNELIHNLDQDLMTVNLVIEANGIEEHFPNLDFASNETITVKASNRLFELIRNNESSIFMHVLLLRSNFSSDQHVSITKEALKRGDALFGSVKLIKYDVIPKFFKYRYLLSDFGLVSLSQADKRRLEMDSSSIISYWKPEVSVKVVADFESYPLGHVPVAVAKNAYELHDYDPLSNRQTEKKFFYKPSLFVDEIGLTSDKYIHLNETVQTLPLKISIGPMSTQRWFLMAQLEDALKTQKGIGFSDKDIDDCRRMISDTSVHFLSITVFASLLHLLFEFLAFQSDIQFWHNNKSLAGLSTRTLVTDLVSQFIVFLYLVENEASMLVIVPAFFAIGVQIWKVGKAFGVKVTLSSKTLISIKFIRLYVDEMVCDHHEEPSQDKNDRINSSDVDACYIGNSSSTENKTFSVKNDGDSTNCSTITMTTAGTPLTKEQQLLEIELTRATLEADRFATRYIGAALIPVVLAFVVHSLVYQRHKSWYSWFIGSLTSSVYTFGFIFMCPQLYINHKLKSVSHLPWNYLIYKFLNTFVDDLFAFIIKMPLMHRLSVFRDDIIFLIYLYQRWIYRVDKNRPTEK